jgi:hypothetical protein
MLPRINALFTLDAIAGQSTEWLTWLLVLEFLYIIVGLLLILSVFIPRKYRTQLLIKHYHFPLLRCYKRIKSNQFISYLIQALAKGVSFHDLLYVLGNGNDLLMSHLIQAVNHALLEGTPLTEAIVSIDPYIKHILLLQDGGQTLEDHLKRYHALQALRIQTMIQRLRTITMSVAYFSSGIILVSAYQLMFEPIRRLEQLL